jgi:hypothetical protein
MHRKFLTHEAATAIYTALRLVGAPFSAQDHFIWAFTNPDGRSQEPPHEWRFQGLFGFGGKFWLDHDGWRVSCYTEDENVKTNYLIKTSNELLAILYEKLGKEGT